MSGRIPTSSMLYGKGVFTTVAVAGGKPVFWDKHWRRLVAHAAAVGIGLASHGEASTKNKLRDAIAENAMDDGRARITLSDVSPSRIWSNTKGEKKTDLSIIVAERRPVPDQFSLTTSPHRANTTSPLVGIKSCNYLEHLLAFEEASGRGYHEAVRLNERGEVVSVCMANLFWEKDGILYTPSLSTGCLAGTTREFIMESTACEEVEVVIDILEQAERIFLSSVGLGIVSVAEFNGRPLDSTAHRLSDLLPY